MLCQIIGEKKIILFDPKDSNYLYPALGTKQPNTSLVDIETPSIEKFPLFSKAKAIEVTLRPGDALFIPFKYWHYCKSLSNSCSVNFWWL